MTENLHMCSQQNVRIITLCKMVEKAQVENTLPGKCTTRKMAEWKLHTMENKRKSTYQKMTEKSQLENARMQIAQPGK